MNISSIIQFDLQLLESSQLVREADDIFNGYIFPFLKTWVQNEADISSTEWKENKDNEYTIVMTVPSYWKIPILRGKKLRLFVTILSSPDYAPVNVRGSMV